MKLEFYYYNCSPEYINTIDPDLHAEIVAIINLLPKRQKQSEINADLFWLLTNKNWYYDTVPQGYSRKPQEEFQIQRSLQEIREWNDRSLCTTSSTLDTRWHADFAKTFDGLKLVQIEAQFGKVVKIHDIEPRAIFMLLFSPNSFFNKVFQRSISLRKIR